MVQAILDGRMTQIKKIVDWKFVYDEEMKVLVNTLDYVCPFGSTGDILWVKETWSPIEFEEGVFYRYRATFKENNCLKPKWKQSNSMPYDACRIKLLIKDVSIRTLKNTIDDKTICWPIGRFRLLFEEDSFIWVITFKRIK